MNMQMVQIPVNVESSGLHYKTHKALSDHIAVVSYEKAGMTKNPIEDQSLKLMVI